MNRPWQRVVLAVALVIACGLVTSHGVRRAWAQGAPIKSVTPRLPAPSLTGGEWHNTAGPLSLRQLRGKFVVLDFWTYCCINCLHTLPELHKLEQAYPNEVVVIGVHSPKFFNETKEENLREAIVRYHVDHPVINDARQTLWRKYEVLGWPSLRIIDPEGFVIGAHGGEATFEVLDRFISRAIRSYKGKIDRTPLHFDLVRDKLPETPLRYPGKVLADEASDRLYTADTGHNRIVITKLDGTLVDIVGNGAVGRDDGTFKNATFDHPQGMALHGDKLYVADTENHSIRLINVRTKVVVTVAGTGKLAPRVIVRSSTRPTNVPLASPWALWIHEDQMYIAMAGKHQIWQMSLTGAKIGPYAGNGTEDIIDGPLLPRTAMQKGFAAFAQPSGLASDGTWLFVADSEGSSIRAVPFRRSDKVLTVIGTSHLSEDRLFTFGDRDGPARRALLQHPLGVAHRDGQLYVADTYNHKIKVIDLKTPAIRTIAGGIPGRADDPPQFNEPSGLSIVGDKLYVADTNNHAIRVVDLSRDFRTSTLNIKDLKPPAAPPVVASTDIPGAKRIPLGSVQVKPDNGNLKLAVRLTLPLGWKLNPAAPPSYVVEQQGDSKFLAEEIVNKPIPLKTADNEFEIELPLSELAGEARIKIAMTYYYCPNGPSGICKVGAAAWSGDVTLSDAATANTIELKHAVR